MKLRFLPFIVLFALGVLALVAVQECRADQQALVWQTPYGTFGLPITATEALIAYDGINKQAIAGFSVPVYTDPKGILALQIGAVAPWQTNEASIQPYVAAGHDIAREIPFLAQYQSFHLNVVGRYDTGNGRPGVGIGVSYGFAGGTLTPATPSAQ